MSNVKIEDYLHLYPFCDIKITHNDKVIVTDSEGKTFFYQSGEIVKSPDPYIVMFDLHKSLFKPILRPLSDMTDEEAFTLAEMNLIQRSEIDKEKPITRNEFGVHVHYWVKTSYEYDEWDVYPFTIHEDLTMSDYMGCCHDQHRTTLYLLKQGFDLFGLIESGLAINKLTLNK